MPKHFTIVWKLEDSLFLTEFSKEVDWVSSVTSTLTRTPIYKAFAKVENIGDVTGKGECVGNVADMQREIINGLRNDLNALHERMNDMQRMLQACMDV
ncbi:protein root UVB sensitive 6 [Tanacetum coccineum]|uniref:Protein root UVB sensitive 6 n=1 Tax=Tanacetum coccineum TaxID=301880 RepID=A0ABQ4X649_9ASTR